MPANMLGNIEPMQVDGPEENENEAGSEETEVDCCYINVVITE